MLSTTILLELNKKDTFVVIKVTCFNTVIESTMEDVTRESFNNYLYIEDKNHVSVPYRVNLTTMELEEFGINDYKQYTVIDTVTNIEEVKK